MVPEPLINQQQIHGVRAPTPASLTCNSWFPSILMAVHQAILYVHVDMIHIRFAQTPYQCWLWSTVARMQIPLTKKHKMRIERIFSCKRMIAYHYLPQVDYCYIFLLRLCISITPPPSWILPRFVVPSTTRKWKQPQVPFAVQPPDGDRTFPTLSFIASLSPVAWVGTLWDTVRAKKGSSFLSLISFL